MMTKARRAPGGCRAQVSSLVQGRQATGTESRGINQRFLFWCNETKTARTAGWRSSPSPPQRHDQRLFAREDYFCQDRLYYLSPSKSLRFGIPSLSYLGRGPRPLYIGLSHHHRQGEEKKKRETRASRVPHQLKNTSPPEACSSSVLVHP